MDAKFTKGPWFYRAKLSGSENHKGFKVGSVYATCDVYPIDENGSEGEANARLIAEAPNFYDVAVSALEWWEQNKYQTISLGDGEEDKLFDSEPAFVIAARIALAKATGGQP